MAELLASAKKPLIIAGGGVIYSDATAELQALAEKVGAPVAETFAGKGAVQTAAWWQVGGIGLEGTPATNTLAREADLVLTVGSRLTDFATGSHSIFANPDVRFASINVDVRDADRLGAVGIIGDAKLALAALADAVVRRPVRAPRTVEGPGRGTDRGLERAAGGRPGPGPAVRQVRRRPRIPTWSPPPTRC